MSRSHPLSITSGPDGRPDDDLALVAAVRRRDERALAVLYDRYSPIVLAHAIRLLHHRADAEGVLLETFMQAWDRADRYDPARGSVAAWLLIIARTRALDAVRARGRRARVGATATDATPEALLHAPDPAPDPARGAVRVEEAAAVAAALRALSDPQRTAIELAFYEGLSHSEIADRLAVPLGTIKTRIRAGMQRLRDLLRPHGGEAFT